MSNNNNQDRQKRIEEARVLEGFMQVIRYRLEHSDTIQNMATMEYSKQAEYAAERRILMTINNLGLAEGILAGAITFLTLRRAPAIIANYVLKRPSYKLDNGAAAQKAPLPFRVVRLGLDVSVSLVIAAGTSLYFTDAKTMMNSMARVPLVEGKSIVADEFCQTVQQEFHKHPKEFWNQTQSLPLKSIAAFCENCRHRAAHQERIRKEQGLMQNEPVSIPPPGVDTSIALQENDGFASEFGGANEFGAAAQDNQLFGDAAPASGEYFGGEEPTWADSMVTDQEEQGKNFKDDNKRGRGF